MERNGFKLDMDHIHTIEKEALTKMEQKKKIFMDFITSFQTGKNIDLFNPSSGLQMQQLLFAPYRIEDQKEKI